MKRIAFLMIGIFFTALSHGHEFWLQPHKFFYYVRETALIKFMVGENFSGENWQGNHDKINTLLHYKPDNSRVDIAHAVSNERGDSLKIPLQSDGTHMITYNSTNSFIELEAEKFNTYLSEDGLTLAQEIRKSRSEQQKNGKEYYQRCVKTILQVGNEITDQCLTPTGMPLEIIPMENPYTTPRHYNISTLPKVKFQVRYLGKPAAGILVKVWYTTIGNQKRMEQYVTNKKGIISTQRHPGVTMISCVHMERLVNDSKADWQSYWASLSFEYSQFFPKSTQ